MMPPDSDVAEHIVPRLLRGAWSDASLSGPPPCATSGHTVPCLLLGAQPDALVPGAGLNASSGVIDLRGAGSPPAQDDSVTSAADARPTGRWAARQRQIIMASYWASTLVEGASRIIIPLHLAALGVNPSAIGVAFLFFEGFGLAASLCSGLIINYRGYKFAFVSSLLLHTIASLGYLVLASDQIWRTLLVVNAMRALRGIGKELIKTTSSAYAKHLAEGRQQSTVQLLLGGKDGVKGIGLLIGGALLGLAGFQGSFVALGLVTLMFTAVAIVGVDDHREHNRVGFRGFLGAEPKLRKLGLARAFLYGGRDVWLVLALPLHLAATGYSEVAIGSMLACGLVIFGLVQPLANTQIRKSWHVGPIALKQRWRYRSVAAAAPCTMALLVAAFALTSIESPALVIGFVICFNLLAGLATVPHNRLHLSYSRDASASIDIAQYKTIAQLGKIAAVPVSGLLYGAFGFRACLLAAAASLALSTAASLTLQTRS